MGRKMIQNLLKILLYIRDKTAVIKFLLLLESYLNLDVINKTKKIKNITMFLLTVIILLIIIGMIRKDFVSDKNKHIIDYKDIDKYYIHYDNNVFPAKIIIDDFLNQRNFNKVEKKK
jgi:hypothetical protein